MSESADQEIVFGEADATTTLTELFILLGAARFRGCGHKDEISAELRSFGVHITEDTIDKAVKRCKGLFDRDESGRVSLARPGGALQLHFLLRAIRALDARNSLTQPRPAFRYEHYGFVRCKWTPSAFAVELLTPREREEEEQCRARPVRG